MDFLLDVGYYSPPWMEAGLSIATIAAGVFFGNVLTAAFIWSMSRAKNYKADKDIPWLVLAGLGLPPAFLVLAVLATGQPQPILVALGLQ